MKLNTKSWHSRLYQFAYNEYQESCLPNNLCEYFWKVVWAIFSLPLYWSGALFLNKNNPETGQRTYLTIMLYMLGMIGIIAGHFYISFFWGGGMEAIKSYSFTHWWWMLPICFLSGLIGTSLIVSSCVGLCYCWVKIWRLMLYKKDQYDFKQPSLLAAWMYAKKKKYCPSIEWEDDKEIEDQDENTDDN